MALSGRVKICSAWVLEVIKRSGLRISSAKHDSTETYTLPRPSPRSASCHTAFTSVGWLPDGFDGEVGRKPLNEEMPESDGKRDSSGLMIGMDVSLGFSSASPD